MRIQPVQGSGINTGWDASTQSFTISNEGNSPFIYVRVNNKIPFQGVVITNNGSGYEEVPDVTISGGGGTGATAKATISNGKVDSIILTNYGNGYDNQSTVEIDPPTGEDGVQAEAYAILNASTGYNLFYDFYEVVWDGVDFVEDVGGLKANFETRDTCPKMYAMPYDIDDPSNQGNFTGNIGISGQGLVYAARLRGVDSRDGRDVYEFFRSIDPSSKCLVTIEDIGVQGGYYSASGFDALSKSSANVGLFWARDINGGELVSGRNYIGYYVGSTFNPYPNDQNNSDPRPIITVVNSLVAGPTGITVVTDVTCVNGVLANTYATIYPSETVQIAEDTKKSFLSLNDTPDSYSGVANYYVAVNNSASGLVFTSTPPSSTVIPSMSFINLKDCPQSYSDSYGKFLTSAGNGIAFTNVAFNMSSNSSVFPNQSNLNSTMSFRLSNDQENPGPNKYYGTNASGVKGWYDLPGHNNGL